MNEILEKVKQYADEAHGSQMRKYTHQRYIVHPIEVMEICREYTSDLCILSAALLHDVLEDTPVTRAGLEAFLLTIMNATDAKRTTDLTVELTDVYTKEAYPQYNRRVRKDKEHVRGAATSPAAQTIKYADIISNSIDIAAHDKDFGPKFLKEVRSQLKNMNKGNAALYARAVATVDECLKKV
jgi:(p)ppGpp synthase/HD superfamily hydrolase